jgi:hypothetical protein
MCEDRNQLRQAKIEKLPNPQESKVFKIEQDSPVNKGEVSCEKKQNFYRSPLRRPDERNFARERQDVVVDLPVRKSDIMKTCQEQMWSLTYAVTLTTWRTQGSTTSPMRRKRPNYRQHTARYQ